MQRHREAAEGFEVECGHISHKTDTAGAQPHSFTWKSNRMSKRCNFISLCSISTDQSWLSRDVTTITYTQKNKNQSLKPWIESLKDLQLLNITWGVFGVGGSGPGEPAHPSGASTQAAFFFLYFIFLNLLSWATKGWS